MKRNIKTSESLNFIYHLCEWLDSTRLWMMVCIAYCTVWKMIFPLNFCTSEIKRFSHLNDRFSFFHHSVLLWLCYLFISFCPIVKAIKENTFTGSGTGLVGLRLRENPFPYSNATNETRILFLCFYVCFFCVYNKNSKRKKISHPTIVVSLTTNIPFT